MRRPQNLKKNLILVWKKQLFLLSSLKTSGGFFQFFVAFSEKLDVTKFWIIAVMTRCLNLGII